MARVAFDFDWLDGPAIPAPELSYTRARLRVTVDDQPVSRIWDSASRTVREHLYLPLYPLAEWIADNWWQLKHEVVKSPASPAPPYLRSHDLQFAGEGYALPELRFDPAGSDTVHLQWSRSARPDSRLEFQESGHATLPLEEVDASLRALVMAVMRRLEDQGLADTHLHRRWSAVTTSEADSEERTFCQIAAALGWDPHDLDPERSDALIRAASSIPASLHDEFFAAVRPEQLEADHHSLLEGLSHVDASTAVRRVLDHFKAHRVGSAPSKEPPWMKGAWVARRVREQCGLGLEPINTLSALQDLLPVGVVKPSWSLSPASWLEGVVGTNRHDSPVLVFPRQRRADAERFLYCRAVFAYLHSPSRQPALLTSARTVTQAQARAFAAELLAPSALLRQRVAARVSEDEVEDLSRELAVSSWVIRHQLENHHIAEIDRSTPGYLS